MTTPIKSMSPSSIGSHEMCPMKNFISSFLKIREKPHPKTEMGTICHNIWQIVALSKLGNQKGEKSTKDSVYGSYTTDYEKLNVEEIISNVADRYITKRPYIKWPEDCREQIRDWSYKVLNTENDPRNFEIVDVESRFKFKVDYDWADYAYLETNGAIDNGKLHISGIVDLIYKYKDRYHILDYKTGQRVDWNSKESKPPVKDFSKLQKDIQLIVYYIFATKEYNTEDITVEINYVNDGGLFPLEFAQKDVDFAYSKIKDTFLNIKNEIPLQNITWKCRAFCDYGRKTFSNINRKDLAMMSDGGQHLTKYGDEYKICEAVSKFVHERPIELVIERCKNG